jgi:protein subunit release factor A
LSKALTGWCDSLFRFGATKTQEPAAREKIARLTAEVEHLSFIAKCRDAQELGDAVVLLSLVEGNGVPQEGVVKLARMFEAMGRRHRMTVEMAGEFFQDKQDRAYLSVTGLGAFSLLKNESGLHQLNHRYRERKPRSGHEAVREDRETIRVEVLPEPKEKIPATQIKSRITTLKPPRSRLVQNSDMHVSVFHEASLRSIEVWTKGPKAQALERVIALLEAELGSGADKNRARNTAIIRQYHLGISSRIKDNRSGKTTTRVDRVLKGYLEGLL